MHRSYRFPVARSLPRGLNSWPSPSRRRYCLRPEPATAGPAAARQQHPFNAIRKMACNYGWDWGPDWSPPASGDRCRCRPGPSPGSPASVRWSRSTARPGSCTAHVEVQRAPGSHRTAHRRRRDRRRPLRGRRAGGLRPGHAGHVPSTDADLWWPRGYGEQPLYAVTRVVGSPTGSGLDELERPGRLPNRHLGHHARRDGTPFSIAVNGVPVFRPRRELDPRRLLSRPGSPESATRARLTQAHDAGRQPGPGLGRRPLRERGLLRRLRRAAGCSSGRTSCSPARPTPRRSRCAAR